MTTRIIGDVHGHAKQYLALLVDISYSVQLGDLSYNYEPFSHLNKNQHVFFPGNHDRHNEYGHNCIGRFGNYKLGDFEFFFVGGAFSIDKEIRLAYEKKKLWPKTWFENEELSGKEIEKCISLYTRVAPKIMITHDCPTEVSHLVGSKGILRDFGFDPDNFTTITQILLDRLYAIHQPDIWLFGHYHKDFYIKLKNTEFRCIRELGFVDWSKKSGFSPPLSTV